MEAVGCEEVREVGEHQAMQRFEENTLFDREPVESLTDSSDAFMQPAVG